MNNYDELVKSAFEKHGVNHPELEKAIAEIISQSLNSRNLSKKIWKDVYERIERDKKIRNSFK
ncbi:hypothetical protein M3210_03055 [Oceanobacillus luteolus]|uniref:serine O-acetyltransferase n=1 Tax=Oceanobacillus luteolus TaxID=1274358 RepID=UPI00203F7031|nr:hypothetical protein [Oceanobacillus luteolus]MCM3739242.1 hypothetical protein [Oceanobacillus luteolus]